MSGSRLLTVAEAAEELGRRAEWVRTLVADGSIPGGRKVRGRWMVPARALSEWVAAGSPQGGRTPVRAMPESVRPLGARRAA